MVTGQTDTCIMKVNSESKKTVIGCIMDLEITWDHLETSGLMTRTNGICLSVWNKK